MAQGIRGDAGLIRIRLGLFPRALGIISLCCPTKLREMQWKRNGMQFRVPALLYLN